MKAYELLSDETAWCQNAFAKTYDGFPSHPQDAASAQWCLLGALERCYGRSGIILKGRPIAAHLFGLRPEEPVAQGPIETWNDARARTYAEVVGLLKRLDI